MRVVFMGSPVFAAASLEAVLAHHEVCLVVTQPDKRAGRGKKNVSPPVKCVAEAAGVPVVQPKSARTPEFLAQLRDCAADVGVVVAYGKILPLAVLETFPHGCVNVHGSLLPRYRGAAPIQWAVINGESRCGVTIMRLDEGMDTGPTLLERAIDIGARDTAGDIFERLAPLGASALIEALGQLCTGDAVFTPQDDSAATHAPMLTKSDGVIDWRQSDTAIVNRIRGVDPWPGAIAHLGEMRLKLFGAARFEQGPSHTDSPGQVIAVDNAGLHVACGSGACVIAEVQAPGKKRMPASVFVRGNAIDVGTVLEPLDEISS